MLICLGFEMPYIKGAKSITSDHLSIAQAHYQLTGELIFIKASVPALGLGCQLSRSVQVRVSETARLCDSARHPSLNFAR